MTILLLKVFSTNNFSNIDVNNDVVTNNDKDDVTVKREKTYINKCMKNVSYSHMGLAKLT